ncbi:MAG TPA: YjgP/YjgQ family permease [Bacteroidetes bacterium]|nr:YjgP/YjgQ family permease [Bacteroidota bacterium]
MRISGLLIIDRYIIRKFLGTFVLALALILMIVVVFDISEKLDDFIEKEAPLKAIIFDYYLNFIPYFAVLFSPLFTFITVIFFTSKMAYNTEIIAILSSGLSFRRLMVPYMISATLLALASFSLSNYVIPQANEKRIAFEALYYRTPPTYHREKNIHRQVRPGIFVYVETYSNVSQIGYKFSMEKFNDEGELESKMLASYIKWDSTINKWTAREYYIRNFTGEGEELITGREVDTTIYLTPSDFILQEDKITETMSVGELNDFIDQQRLQGASNVEEYLIELYNRFAFPFSTLILTLIGVALSTRKVKGGMGVHIGFGLFLTFSYLLFMQFSQQFAIGGAINPLLATWIPNILYGIIALVLYKMAPK